MSVIVCNLCWTVVPYILKKPQSFKFPLRDRQVKITVKKDHIKLVSLVMEGVGER